MSDYRHHFKDSLSTYASKLHFAAHSHHFWPDVSKIAAEQLWGDTMTLADEKWDKIFSQILPQTRSHIAHHLNLSDPNQIALAPNTHEFVDRILSSFVGKKKVRILTTDQEFYSFRRQAERYAELPEFEIQWLPVEPYETFEGRLLAQIEKENWDLVFLSQVFFTSGFEIPDLPKIVSAIKNPQTYIVIDGYHGFFAIPTDLKKIEHRIFYMAGGYKYAMAGEGICFLHIPRNTQMRPLNTGWFAEFDHLAAPHGQRPKTTYFSDNHFRFAGSTMDPLPAYRMNAVMGLLKKENITVEKIHTHVENLKKEFIKKLDDLKHPDLNSQYLVKPFGLFPRSHFLTFQTPKASVLCQELKKAGIYTDSRQDRLRFGFGLYHHTDAIQELFTALTKF